MPLIKHSNPFGSSIWSKAILDSYTRSYVGAALKTMSLHEQILDYLARLRHVLPFPVNREEVYFECFPPVIREWAQMGYLKPGVVVQNTRDANLIRLLCGGSIVPITSRMRTSIRLTDGVSFWIKLDFDVPRGSGVMGLTPEYPQDGPHAAKLLEWLEAVTNLDTEIEEKFRVVKTLHNVVKTQEDLQAAFPELLNFVSLSKEFKNRRNIRSTMKLKNEVHHLVNPQQRKELLDMLATAVLLPEKVSLTAWGGYTP